MSANQQQMNGRRTQSLSLSQAQRYPNQVQGTNNNNVNNYQRQNQQAPQIQLQQQQQQQQQQKSSAFEHEDISQFINDSFVESGQLNDICKEKCRKVVSFYGGYDRQWTWAPNASDTQIENPPSGFIFSVSMDAPVCMNLFNSKKFFYGSMAFKLPNGTKLSTGEFISEDKIAAISSKYSSILCSAMSASSLTNASTMLTATNISQAIDSGKEAKSMSWEPSFGGGTSAYSGIFCSESHNEKEWKKDYWVVVQSGHSELSESFFQYLEDKVQNDQGNSTIRNVFFGESMMTKETTDAIKENRRRLMIKTINDLGFVLPEVRKTSRSTSTSMPSNSVLNYASENIKPTISTTTNNFLFDSKTKLATYYANTVDPSNISNGIIFSKNPKVGVSIIKGPHSDNHEYGGSWEIKSKVKVGFPICTGRVAKMNDIQNVNTSLVSSDSTRNPQQKNTFVWNDSDKNKSNVRLNDSVYRTFDSTFKKSLSTIGYDFSWSTIDLKPILVKIPSGF